MIRDVLLPALQRNFPERGLRIDRTSNPIAAFPATCVEVGAVTIWEDGDEATVVIEQITHSHFGRETVWQTRGEIDRYVTEKVIAFLEALFQDKVLLWVSLDRRAGGWRRLDLGTDSSLVSRGGSYYVWSGPIDDIAAFIRDIATSKSQS